MYNIYSTLCLAFIKNSSFSFLSSSFHLTSLALPTHTLQGWGRKQVNIEGVFVLLSLVTDWLTKKSKALGIAFGLGV